jgi:polyhydroxyalkanoate synthesis regulator phasin
MQEAWRAYLELALGATEASRKKATKAVKRLVGKGGATAEQLQALAADLVATGSANREGLAKLVRYEVDRTLGRVGLATADEVHELTDRVRDLERRLRAVSGDHTAEQPLMPVPEAMPAGSGRGDVPPPGAVAMPVTDSAAKRTVAKKTVAGKTVAKKTVAKKTVAKKAVPAPAGTTATPVAAKKAPKAAAAAARPVGKRATTPTSRRGLS